MKSTFATILSSLTCVPSQKRLLNPKATMVKKLLPFSIFLFFAFANEVILAQPAATFRNPLLPSGADPWSIYKDGYYYYTHTLGNRLMIWKTKSIARLAHAKKKTVFAPPAGTAYSKGLWAPEIHYIDHAWYMYFAADNGRNE